MCLGVLQLTHASAWFSSDISCGAVVLWQRRNILLRVGHSFWSRKGDQLRRFNQEGSHVVLLRSRQLRAWCLVVVVCYVGVSCWRIRNLEPCLAERVRNLFIRTLRRFWHHVTHCRARNRRSSASNASNRQTLIYKLKHLLVHMSVSAVNFEHNVSSCTTSLTRSSSLTTPKDWT